MKVTKFVIFLIFLSVASAAYFCHYHFKSECQASNKTVRINKCRTIPVRRYLSTFSIEVEVLKKVTHGSFDLTVEFKSPGFTNFNRLFQLKNISYCDMLGNPPWFLQDWMNYCVKEYPNLCKKCPIQANSIIALNYTENVTNLTCPSAYNGEKPNLFQGSWLPDGEYKTSLKFYITNVDKEALSIKYFYKMKTGDSKAF